MTCESMPSASWCCLRNVLNRPSWAPGTAALKACMHCRSSGACSRALAASPACPKCQEKFVSMKLRKYHQHAIMHLYKTLASSQSPYGAI